ncbi:hypothetical protein BC833DRAFT_574468 [Globomyces pollinis-pini]|nr:hypothetical protein BC833DRAFT_574468 [Globomyces pollinis-pini]
MDNNPQPPFAAAVQLANGEFIKGFISGQVILCILIFFLLKVFLLRNSTETKLDLQRLKTQSFVLPKVRSMTVQQKHTSDSIVLSKLQYDTTTHPLESCDWLNILMAQLMSALRNDPTFLEGLATKLDHAFNNNSQKRPSFVGPISITEFTLGDEFPEFKSARVRFGDKDGNMRTQMDFSFDDQITIALETQALINWPKAAMASLPITLSFTLLKFSGTIVVEFVPQSTSDKGSLDTALSFFIMEDFILDFGVSSLLGHRTKVKDLPKLTSLITSTLRAVFVQELVYPARKTFKLPNGYSIFTPKTANTSSNFNEEARSSASSASV